MLWARSFAWRPAIPRRLIRLACRWLLPSALVALGLPGIAVAAPGDLDPGFGASGQVITDFGGTDVAHAVAVQPDGKLVVAGRTNTGGNATFALARYHPDGRPDAAFGTGGVVVTDFGSTDQALAVALQPDGKIVTAGRRGSDVIVARHDQDGTLDSAFGAGGRVITNFGATELALAVALQPDGQILVAGRTNAGGHFDFALARYQANGVLDPGYGTAGLVTTDFGGTVDRAFALVLQPDGKAIAAGDADANFALVRYNVDGSLDATFGAGGRVVTTFGGIDQASAVALQADGKIVAAGQTDNGTSTDIALARYNPDGSLDATFGTAGRVTTDFASGSDDLAAAVALQFDGKIVIGGASNGNFAVARYQPDGGLDAIFGSAGTVTTNLGGDDQVHALVLQPDGAIVVAGEAADQFALVRYLAFDPLSLQLESSRTVVMAGDTVDIALTVENPGPPRLVDAYFGILLPPAAGPSFGCPGGDAVVFFGPGLGAMPTCLSADPGSFTPLASSAMLPGALASTTTPGFFSMVWPAGSPPGAYTFFIALVRPGTLDVLATTTVTVSSP